MKKYQLVSGLLAIACMIMIFAFSAQPADDSGEVSDAVSIQLLTTANRWFGLDLDYERIREIAEIMEPAVRKLAHAAEYGLLGLLLFLFMDSRALRPFKQAAVAIMVSFLYAASDEIHQLFVPGRYGCASDVLIDGAGAAVVVLCVVGVRKCISFLWKRNKYAEPVSSSGEMM